MNRSLPRLLAPVLCAALAACGPSRSKKVDFSGTWKIETENGVSGAKEAVTVAVTAAKDMFKMDTKTTYGEDIVVYDGQMLHEKHRRLPATSADGAPADGATAETAPSDSPTRSEPKSVIQTGPLRFWSRSYAGKAGPGGQIAGRDTVLYQAREKRPDGELTAQAWVDAETGIVLKSVDTIYSSQISSMVMKMTRECQEISYSTVDPSAFAKP